MMVSCCRILCALPDMFDMQSPRVSGDMQQRHGVPAAYFSELDLRAGVLVRNPMEEVDPSGCL